MRDVYKDSSKTTKTLVNNLAKPGTIVRRLTTTMHRKGPLCCRSGKTLLLQKRCLQASLKYVKDNLETDYTYGYVLWSDEMKEL